MLNKNIPCRSSVLRRFSAFAALAYALGGLACASDPPPPPAVPVAESAPPPPAPEPPPPPPPVASVAKVQIAEDILKACGIAAADAFFDYDSDSVKSAGQTVLSKIATCFASGPLKGRQMRLVGHADPRGDEEYNLVLGQRRADSVKGYLVGQGMPGGQATTTSRGEQSASGTEESSWATDRRVDILLAN